VQEAIHADDQQLDQTEIVSFWKRRCCRPHRTSSSSGGAARDKINEMKGAPTRSVGRRRARSARTPKAKRRPHEDLAAEAARSPRQGAARGEVTRRILITNRTLRKRLPAVSP